ncbi:MAG: C39 family peptidase [Eubacteriales bacterium]|nr:C39 family peptidase [Eubacteriales bacterium]
MKTKRRIITVFLVLLITALAAVLGKKPLYYLYRDVSYYFGERTEAEQTVKAFAEEHHISYGRYPEDLIELLEINPETEDFILNYPFREEMDMDLSGYSRDTVPLFLQWDPMWGYEPYGSGCIAQTGCGPTCLAMAGYYLTGDDTFNPKTIADFSEENGYYADGYGSSWTLISEGAEKLGLTVEELPLVEGKLVEAVEAGHPVILALGKGDFTSSGHYIVLTGWEDGVFQVNDPNSRIRSEKLWTYEELESQIRNIWEISVS